MSVSIPSPAGMWVGYTPNINSTPGSGGANYASVNDAYVSGSAGQSPYPNGAFNPVGSRYFWCDGQGHTCEIIYVQYNPTAAVSLSASNVPGVVYWKDATKTIVTPTASESVIGAKTGAEAGILLNVNVGAGNYTFIQSGGYLAGCNVPASTAVGDVLIGVGATPLALARVANGTAPTAPPVAVAWSAINGSNQSNINIILAACN